MWDNGLQDTKHQVAKVGGLWAARSKWVEPWDSFSLQAGVCFPAVMWARDHRHSPMGEGIGDGAESLCRWNTEVFRRTGEREMRREDSWDLHEVSTEYPAEYWSEHGENCRRPGKNLLKALRWKVRCPCRAMETARSHQAKLEVPGLMGIRQR